MQTFNPSEWAPRPDPTITSHGAAVQTAEQDEAEVMVIPFPIRVAFLRDPTLEAGDYSEPQLTVHDDPESEHAQDELVDQIRRLELAHFQLEQARHELLRVLAMLEEGEALEVPAGSMGRTRDLAATQLVGHPFPPEPDMEPDFYDELMASPMADQTTGRNHIHIVFGGQTRKTESSSDLLDMFLDANGEPCRGLEDCINRAVGWIGDHTESLWGASFNTPAGAMLPGSTGGVMTTAQLQDSAMKWANQNLQLGASDSVTITRAYTDSLTGLHHCYMMKQHQGLDVVNSVAQMTVTTSGNLIAYSSSWVNTTGSVNLVKRSDALSCKQALQKVAENNFKESTTPDKWTVSTSGSVNTISGVQFTSQDVTCKEAIYGMQNDIQHVYSLTVPTPSQHVNLMVDMSTGAVLGATDYTSRLRFTPSGRLVKRYQPSLQKRETATNPTFFALQLGALDPETVPPSLIRDPIDTVASPAGWNDNSGITQGNNVIATENSRNIKNINQIKSNIATNPKQAKSNNFVFNFPVNLNKDPTTYTAASITNAFFLANRFHDILYQYGFDEQAGNFQTDNGQKGGRGNDAVVALVQDGSGTDNANFASPPDGQPGVMRMFIFSNPDVRRDGALENAVVLHELTHGLSTRLTGGPDAGNCLSTPEAGGLGEGWSDIVAIVLEMEDIDTPQTLKVVGQYAANNTVRGVRQFPYSTSLKTNPHTFADGQKTTEVHAVGEIWTSMLFEVYWNMVQTAGFDRTFRTNPLGTNGNNQFIKTLVAGMKIQPCFPTFVTARNAILAADKSISGGKFQCEIIKGFAKRGLGINAQDGSFVNDFTIPANCK
ncbi:ammonium transporter [Kappamyces sp. JEL0829]|nr:ammonium transporter [Kappamyces sp. JEL0829]